MSLPFATASTISQIQVATWRISLSLKPRVVAAGVLTFRGPFVATGNGYCGTWLGFACALAFAWQEFY